MTAPTTASADTEKRGKSISPQKSIGNVFHNGLFGKTAKAVTAGLALSFALAAAPAFAGGPGQLNPVHGEADFYAQVIKDGQPAFVEFYADWCGYCKAMKPTIEEIARENPNVKVLTVNVDEPANARLTQAFAAKGIPAYIIAKNGKPVAHGSGYFENKTGFKQWVASSLRK
jgi:thioredoxin 1